MPALCKSTHCTYSYEELPSLITGFTVSGQDVQITGVDLPIDITRVSFSNQECTVTSSSLTTIECLIADPLVTGTWFPQVYTSAGLVRVDPLVAPKDVPIQIDDISPTSFRESGGEIVTISGQNFPASLAEGSDITLQFSDSTKCIVQSMSTTQITCEVQPFETTSRRRDLAATTFIIFINGKQFEISIDVPDEGFVLQSITPASASPIKTQLLTL